MVASEPRNLFLRSAGLLLALGAAGIPLNEPTRLVVFFLAAIWLGTGRLHIRLWNWAAAIAILALVTIASHLLPIPRIQEGHNLFLPVADGNVLERGLPAPVYDRMNALFDLQYPKSNRCGGGWCWAQAGGPDRTFAFSADGVWSRPHGSRIVDGISFDGIRTLRLGDINSNRYNMFPPRSDVARPTAPYFVAWQLPEELVGSQLCWRGETMWGRDQSFISYQNKERGCREILSRDVGSTVFAIGILPDSLAVDLQKSGQAEIASNIWLMLRLAGVVAIAALLALPTRHTLIAVALSGAAFLTLAFAAPFPNPTDPNEIIIPSVHGMLMKMPSFLGGDDGLTYEGYGRAMLQDALGGNWAGFLRGVESVYYFQPGMRYFRAIEKIFFGETAYGYLLVFSMFPFTLYKLTRYLTAPWVGLLLGVLLFVGIGGSLGIAYRDYVYWTLRGFAEPMACMVFLLAIYYALNATDLLSVRDAALCGSLVAATVFLRTNFAIASLALLATLAIHLGWRRAFPSLAVLVVTSALTLLIPLHNIYFGKQFVLLTSQVDLSVTLLMTPGAYAAAIMDVITGDAENPLIGRMLHHLGLWLGTEGGNIPFHVALLIALVVALCCTRIFAVHLLAVTACALQSTLMFWRPESRFGLLAWLLTVLAILSFLYRDVLPRSGLSRRITFVVSHGQGREGGPDVPPAL